MGAEPWFYFVPYQADLNKALAELKQREFEAGRYHPATRHPVTLLEADTRSPGAQHPSIAAAIEAAGADGTRSILDMQRVATDPDDVDYGVVTPVPEEYLLEEFGTRQPTHEMVEEDLLLSADVDRGHGVYAILYRDRRPSEILFAGYSYD